MRIVLAGGARENADMAAAPLPQPRRRAAVSPARARPAAAEAAAPGSSALAFPPRPVPLRRSATEDGFCCPMCLDILIDPVTLMCGHTACRSCLIRHFESLDANRAHREQLRDSGFATCPLARCPIPFIMPEVNFVLRSTVLQSHPERVAARLQGDEPAPDALQARINYLHARAAASGFGGLSPEDRRVVQRERLRNLYAQGIRLLVARLPQITRRWFCRESALLVHRCVRAAVAIYALTLCFWALGCPLWDLMRQAIRAPEAQLPQSDSFCTRRQDAAHVLAETTIAWLVVVRLLVDWAVLGLCITLTKIGQRALLSRASRGWLGLK